MRIAFIAILVACMISGTNPAAPVVAEQDSFADASFFETLDRMVPALSAKLSHDAFVVDTAVWDDVQRQLIVSARTTNEKGTLITLMGIPASTMVDSFRISTDHSVEYRLPLDEGQAVPCQVVIRSAFASETVYVAHAPSACQSLYQVSGMLALSSTSAMARGWVTVTVDEIVFATIANDQGAYDLEVYSQSGDAYVTITAEGKINNKESVVHVYAGNLDDLLLADRADSLSTFTWAVEIYGRRHFRLMMAAAELP
jgi:hypothetical protein